ARRRTGTVESPSGPPKPSSILRPILAGMATTALLLYASGWGLTPPPPPSPPGKQTARSKSTSTGASTSASTRTTMMELPPAGFPHDSRFRHEEKGADNPLLGGAGRDGGGGGGRDG
ncbi:unnamed protein product, partial [Laminaria digitata]